MDVKNKTPPVSPDRIPEKAGKPYPFGWGDMKPSRENRNFKKSWKRGRK